MNTDLLRTFLEVAKTRHFGQAAENLCLTQSAVSFRIRQLEDTVGVELFVRQRNNILLTFAGERLLPHAENILASWQLALQDVGFSTEKNTQVTLGSTSNLWDTFLRSLLPQMAENLPSLFIRTEINSTQELIRSLMVGRADIAVVLDPPQLLEFEVAKIGAIELVLVGSDPRISIDEIASVGYIFVDWGAVFNLQNAKLFNIPVAPKLHTSQTYIALEFMLSHGGVAYLPFVMVAPYLESGSLHKIDGAESISRDIYVVYNKSVDRIDSVEPVVAYFKEVGLQSK